jgi:hypothetical protein
MNPEQVKAVQEVLKARLPQLDRFQITALALELVEAVENKATPVTVAGGVTVVNPKG